MRALTADPAAYAFGEVYVAIVGPAYGFFGLGMVLYFASQGARTMAWPIAADTVRFVIAAGPATMFALVAAGLVSFGGLLIVALFTRAWRPA